MNLKKTVVVFENPKKRVVDPSVLGWGFVCRAGTQIPILGLKIKKLLFSHLGSLLILISLIGLVFWFGPVVFFEARYQLSRHQEDKKTPGVSAFGELAQREINASVQVVPDINFSLIIPKIGAKAKVTANVDPANESEYAAALKVGVAHTKGTFFPGMDGNITLFAHSTDAPINISRYNAVFYLLKELEKDDVIFVYFQGVKHSYRVVEKKITEATDTQYFKKQPGQELLVLQTCWPPGTSYQRLLVLARPY